MSILIIAILASIAFRFSSDKLRARAERTTCESNLKSLYGGFSTYMLDYGHWPQLPEHDAAIDSGPGEEAYWEFWITTLKPFGIEEKHWMCPTDLRERNRDQKPQDRDKFEGSYTPTEFDAGSETPRKWRQPWLMERGDFHGDGPLIVFPDGSIEPWPWPAL
jgi:hypothetical protein